ncbi:uncharacterized protein zgc:113176 isoform X2 [Astyanax mexicanus]|uniref:uncharacterized protein zgc:113176 isoform X2 n=1 Tax=Astyanax mexicanus TaxID=7994 RepID=UPI0020CB39F7|nr:uncharacterized protein zgc:113176 isoform X2 [Astyanax mexicanus]
MLVCLFRVCMAQTKQGERTVITEAQKLSLKALFDKGMTRVGSPLISTAVAETGLPQHVIENWIGNYRRVLHPARNTLTKPKLHTRELSAYNLFCRDLLRNKGTMADIKERWSSLEEEDRNKYIQEAADLKEQGQAEQLTSEIRELKIRKHLKQLKIEVSQLDELGVETVVLLYDGLNQEAAIHELSSKKASDFLQSTGTGNKFGLYFAGNLPACSKAISMDAIPVMVHKVQDLFNQKYKEAGGVGRLPYQSLAAGKVAVDATGLPNDLPLKKPCLYGRQQLAAILEHGTGLSFKIRSDQSATVCSLEESTVTLQSICSDGQTPEAACNSEDSGPGTSAGENHAEKTAVEILEAICVDDSQLAAADCHTEETAVEIVEAMCVDDASSLCCICRIHFNDKQKNATKKWRSWSQCTVCHQWSHTACNFKRNMCYLCQCK